MEKQKKKQSEQNVWDELRNNDHKNLRDYKLVDWGVKEGLLELNKELQRKLKKQALKTKGKGDVTSVSEEILILNEEYGEQIKEKFHMTDAEIAGLLGYVCLMNRFVMKAGASGFLAGLKASEAAEDNDELAEKLEEFKEMAEEELDINFDFENEEDDD